MKNLDLALLIGDWNLFHYIDNEPLERYGRVREMYSVQLLKDLFEAVNEGVVTQHAYGFLSIYLFCVYMTLAPDLSSQLWRESLVKGYSCAVDARASCISQHEAEVGWHTALRREDDA